jgi:CubicO group peptidase (beta-lactamase class C family)
MRNGKLCRRELLMTSTALAAGAMVMHPFDAFSQPSSAQGALIARAKSLELDTPYVPPPGDALEHHAAGFAKIMCSGVFVTGLDPDFAAENVGTAPIPEWQSTGDSRAKIRIGDLMHMSSGLRIRAPQDPDHDPAGPYPDHLYLYTGGINSFHYAATRPLQWPPNAVGRYRNTDPVLINYLIRLAVEKRGEDYFSFPRRALFDKIGIRTMVMDTDPYGNFLTQGYELACGRDWARLGNLYLQDGMWNGEQILPEGYAKFVSTVASAWEADKRPIYGAFFWINGDGRFPLPKEAYYMSGAGGQWTLIIPSHDLVVVRLGH